MDSNKAGARSELQVVSVAPSDRALWRIRRLTARAHGRPQLAIRRVIAEAAERKHSSSHAQSASSEVRILHPDIAAVPTHRRAAAQVSPEDAGCAKRRRLRSVSLLQTEDSKVSEDLKKARREVEALALQKARCEGQLAVERRRIQELKVQSEIQLSAQKTLLTAERHKNQALQEKVAEKEWQHEGLLREKNRLSKRVQELLHASQISRAQSSSPPQQVLAKQIAEMECKPLQNKSPQARAALKKKLLVKWHPDKQPSEDHATIATSVMQEIQNCAEWRR